MKQAILALEDGLMFKGKSFGAEGEKCGEVVFNTSMTGYQEIITDPSYKGQIVIMTYPLIGNYGVNSEDVESKALHLEGFVVKENSRRVSNWRAEKSLHEYLKKNNVVGIEGIDTRRLTKHIRSFGAKKGIISTIDEDTKSLIQKAKNSPSLVGRDLVKEVIPEKAYDWPSKENRYSVVVLDCGAKSNIMRLLDKYHCQVKVVPANTKAEDILALDPDGIMLSNGPGDPEAVMYVVEEIKKLLGKVPIFGICLGHQLLGLALGAKTYKLKFGHHGANHPVMDMATRKVDITSQNHGFVVDPETLNKDEVEITHMNLYDNTVEGISHKKFPAFSVQYHPEAGPGPHDANHLFEKFVNLMKLKAKTTID